MRVKTSIFVDKKLWEKFKEIALKKHNFKYGSISEELEKLIKNYIDEHEHTNTQKHMHAHTNVKHRNPPDKVFLVWQRVKSILASQGYIHQTTLKFLSDAIMEVRGTDKRTIKKWIKLFEKYGFVKHLGNNIFEIN